MPKTVISWRDCPEEFVGTEWNPYGYETKLPNIYKASCGEAMWRLRNASDSIVIQSLCVERTIPDEQIKLFMEIVEEVELGDAFNHIPTAYCLAWWALKSLAI